MSQSALVRNTLRVAAVLLLTLADARAALLVYEGFSYPAGGALTNAANGAGNSFGWAARWNGISATVGFATNFAGNLGYADALSQELATDGGKVIIGVPGGITANSQLSRSFNLGTLTGNTYSGLTNSATTYWASFLMQWVGQPTAGSTTNLYVRKGVLQFRSGALTNATSTGTQLLGIGSPNALNRLGTPYDTWSTWTGADAANGVQNTGLAASTNPLAQATLVLTRIDLDGINGLDTVYTWFNWTNLAVEPSIETASTTNNTVNEDGWNNIRIDANGGNAAGTNTVLALDEFRLGTSFADVAPIDALPQPPSITLHPASQTIVVTNPVTFSITATGDAPLSYQWYFNATNVIPDATNTSYTIASTTTNDSGQYLCVVTNNNGASTSLVATLSVVLPVPPTISTQPQHFTNVVGFNATFIVSAAGTAPLRYQWYFNNAPLATRTNASLVFPIASANDAGNYFVTVTNLFGADTSSVATLAVVPGWPSGLPAFPGADGAAKSVSGGRGGIVYHVTKLDRNMNHGEPGTLRYGLTDANFPPGVPRTIVFDVAGTFWLGRYGAESNHFHGWDAASRYNISGNTTVAGQTAPGPVIIAGGTTRIGSVNVIVRNITFAPSYGMRGFEDPPSVPPTPGNFPDSFIFDALGISGQNVMLDHLTCVYATDAAIYCNEQSSGITIQYCAIAQGENYPQHNAANPGTYIGRALGTTLFAGSNAKISVIRNFSAHLRTSNPYVAYFTGTGAFNDIRNNVIYNWLGSAGVGGPTNFNNFINNYYLAGPGGEMPSGTNIISVLGGTGIFFGQNSSNVHVFASGDLKDINFDGDPYDPQSADGDYTTAASEPTAYPVDIGLTLPSPESLTNVLRHAGPRWWARPYDFTLGNTNAITTNDIAAYVDERLILEAVTGTGKIVAWADDPFDSDPNEGFEWKALVGLRADTNTFAAPFNRPAGWDTDGDGLPDAWETAHDLNPNVANNNGDFDTDGYTDLDEYLNDLAAWPAPGVIQFTGNTNNRYASIFNWQVNGQAVNISGQGMVTTFSLWQPSRYDTAIISNLTCYVDVVGQHAGTLRLTNAAALNITNGWLKVASNLEISANSTACVLSPGGLHVTNDLVNAGTLLLSGNAALTVGGTFTNTGTLDIMTWSGPLPAGFVNTGTVLDRSLVKLTSPALTGTNFTATIQGYPKHNYQLQFCDDLGTASWQNVGSAVAGSNAPINFTHTGGVTATQRFYRVMVNP